MSLAGVAFGHDWLTRADSYDETLEHLASWGIVAAAPTPRRAGAVGDESGVRSGTTLDIIAGVRLGPGNISVHPSKLGVVGHGFGGSAAVFTAAGMPAKPKTVVAPVSDGHQAARRGTRVDAASSGLVLTAPGDPATLAARRGRAVCAPGKTPRCAPWHDAKAGGLIEGRRLARLVGLPGADRSTQKVVRALLTGYLLFQLTGDKTYRDFADPEAPLPKSADRRPERQPGRPREQGHRVAEALTCDQHLSATPVASAKLSRTSWNWKRSGVDVAGPFAEAYSCDAVSQLGYLAAKTSTASSWAPAFSRSTSAPRRCWR